MASNTSDLKIACVYALSGTYGALPRFLYYATLALAIFGRSHEWLVIGALVSSLAYAATTAIHAMALVTSKKGIFDIDALGSWAVLSTAAVAYIAMIHWSSTLRNSNARIVMVIWGALIGVALVFNRAILYDTAFSDFENPCYSTEGVLLTSPLQLARPEFNCTYQCFSFRKPMRSSSEVIAVPEAVLVNRYSTLSLVVVGPVMFAAAVAVTWDSQEHTPSQLLTRLVMGHLDPSRKEELVKLIYNASSETWYGGYFVFHHFLRRSPWSFKKVYCYAVAYPWLLLGLFMDMLCLPFLIVNVTLNELHLLKSGLPINEAMYNVGQWSPVVNSALVVLAAIINKGLEVWQDRKAQRNRSNSISESSLQRVQTDATLVADSTAEADAHRGAFDSGPSVAHSQIARMSSNKDDNSSHLV